MFLSAFRIENELFEGPSLWVRAVRRYNLGKSEKTEQYGTKVWHDGDTIGCCIHLEEGVVHSCTYFHKKRGEEWAERESVVTHADVDPTDTGAASCTFSGVKFGNYVTPCVTLSTGVTVSYSFAEVKMFEDMGYHAIATHATRQELPPMERHTGDDVFRAIPPSRVS